MHIDSRTLIKSRVPFCSKAARCWDGSLPAAQFRRNQLLSWWMNFSNFPQRLDTDGLGNVDKLNNI